MNPRFILLYVADPTRSAAFYAGLLGRGPAEASPSFVMFALESGVMLGLWTRTEVLPPATAPGGAEICFTESGADAVRSRHAEWRRRGIRIVQEPTAMDFGLTFVGLDPDGHRLRVFAPSGA